MFQPRDVADVYCSDSVAIRDIFGYEPAVDGGVDYRFLDNQLIIYSLNDKSLPSTKDVALIYIVEDVDMEYKRLSSLEIAEEPPTNKPWGVRSFIINDPDGNTISFFMNL